ncbi:MAG: hypothetical protein WCY93_10630 [Anaerolineaceae bacterium]
MFEHEDVSLLQRFEPILKFTRGEQFFPYNVDDYVNKSSLWVKEPKLPPREILAAGELELERLGHLKLEGARTVHYLKFSSLMNLAEMAEYRLNELRETIKTGKFNPGRSRLARVGYLARLVDTAFSLVLLLRGRVPGDSAVAAMLTYKEMLAKNRSFQYYGRVIRENGWIVLQYWFFYPYNNWRTGFFGANDHEADWEMINVYVYEDQQGEVQPAWVAYASHNFSGDDLRRHWLDPELQKVGEHPVVFVGGGSHASYFTEGEYLMEFSLPFLSFFSKYKDRLNNLFSRVTQNNQMRANDEEAGPRIFTIPFVDYATGDGFSIGSGCEEHWAPPILIDPPPGWVTNYRGLWGFYAQDPFSGEDAPAGPRYNRDGTVRLAWFDPLGWAGLEKVIPPDEQGAMLASRKADLQNGIDELAMEINKLQRTCYARGFDLMAIQKSSHLQPEVVELTRMLASEREKLAEKRRRLTVEQAKLEAISEFDVEDASPNMALLRAHIKHSHKPQEKKSLRFNWVAEIWAAVSIGLMIIAVVLLVIFARPFLGYGLVGLLLLMITIEAAFKRRLANLVRWISIILAIFSLMVLVVQFFSYIILAVVVITGVYMIISNLRELFSRR